MYSNPGESTNKPSPMGEHLIYFVPDLPFNTPVSPMVLLCSATNAFPTFFRGTPPRKSKVVVFPAPVIAKTRCTLFPIISGILAA